jgi:hypothetical protein
LRIISVEVYSAPRLQKPYARIFFLRAVQMPRVAGQKHQRAIVVFGEVGTLRVGERFQRDRVGAFDPARGFDSGALERRGQSVFGFDARGQHFELQRADDAHDPLRAGHRLEHLRRALFGEMFQSAAHMLDLHRVADMHALQKFGRETRHAQEAQTVRLRSACRRSARCRGSESP